MWSERDGRGEGEMAHPMSFRTGTPAARVYPVTEGMALRACSECDAGDGERCGASGMGGARGKWHIR